MKKTVKKGKPPKKTNVTTRTVKITSKTKGKGYSGSAVAGTAVGATVTGYVAGRAGSQAQAKRAHAVGIVKGATLPRKTRKKIKKTYGHILKRKK